MPFQNPLTEPLYRQKRNDIINHFPFLTSSQYIIYFEDYFKSIPQKYYNKEAFKDFLYFLNVLKYDYPHILNRLLIEREDKLSLAIANLESINIRKIHNISLPKELYLSRFIQEDILFNLLKLWESVFCEFFYIVAVSSRECRGKSTEGLDIFNIVEELGVLPTNFERLKKYKSLYNSTIRNGIGHGKVEYLDGKIKFMDKNGKTVEKYNGQIINIFDDLVDILNGFCFALKTFYLKQREYLHKQKINIPNSIMLKEVIASASAPKWDIKGYLESFIQDKKNINIFIETEFEDIYTLRVNIFHTGILAAELTNKYDRVSLQLKNGLSGLAVFDATKVRESKLNEYEPKTRRLCKKNL